MMHENNEIVISTRNLSKVYKLYRSPQDRLKEALHPGRKKYHKDFYALKDVNLEIRRGEVIGIVGKNGSGKSTLLKILSRVLTPSSGEFMVKGKVSSLLELGSGFNPELTGMENIFFYGTILGFSEEKIRGKLQEILDFAEIGDFVYQPLKTYSSGMKARLAFSVAINVDPDILILDEVLAVGDELFRRKCYARMEGFFKGGKTILFVSHDISAVNQFCSRAIMLDRGEFFIEGPPKLITTQYQRYLFSTSENTTQVREEIIKMNDDTALKEATYKEIRKGTPEDKYISEPVQTEEHTNSLDAKRKSKTAKERAYYVTGLEPKSRVEYKNHNVEITDVCITTLNGKKVNILYTGEDYLYNYKVRFDVDAENITFGMTFKTESGIRLSAAGTVGFDMVEKKITAGTILQVQWMFNCSLLDGNYFTNVGVASLKNGNRIVLNRIVDAMMFKVEKAMPQKKLYGLVSLQQKPTVTFI